MEFGDRLWTAGASDGYLFPLAIFFNIILINIQKININTIRKW